MKLHIVCEIGVWHWWGPGNVSFELRADTPWMMAIRDHNLAKWEFYLWSSYPSAQATVWTTMTVLTLSFRICSEPNVDKGNGSLHWSEVKLLGRVWLFATPWTVAYQDPQSMGFSRQKYWSGCHFLLQFPSTSLPFPYFGKKVQPLFLSWNGTKELSTDSLLGRVLIWVRKNMYIFSVKR